MNRRIGEKTIPLRTFDGTGTKESSLPLTRESPIVKAKVRTGTEVAVEFLRIVTFFILREKGTEIRLVLNHILKPKIFDHFLITQVCQFVHNRSVFLGVGIEPLFIRHSEGGLLTDVTMPFVVSPVEPWTSSNFVLF
jgi:hypothetical protein